MLSKQALDEYREIYRSEHGTVPPDEVLVEEATKLLTVLDHIYRPIKKVWLDEYQDKHKKHDIVSGPQQLQEIQES